MRRPDLFVTALLTCILIGCASTGAQYSINDIDDQDVKDLQKPVPEPIHGHWISADTLQVTLIYEVPSASILPKESLRAEIVDDVVQLHLALKNDESRDPKAPIALCGDNKKVIYVLHGLKQQPYKVHLFMNLYGNDYAWDIKPLMIRD